MKTKRRPLSRKVHPAIVTLAILATLVLIAIAYWVVYEKTAYKADNPTKEKIAKARQIQEWIEKHGMGGPGLSQGPSESKAKPAPSSAVAPAPR